MVEAEVEVEVEAEAEFLVQKAVPAQQQDAEVEEQPEVPYPEVPYQKAPHHQNHLAAYQVFAVIPFLSLCVRLSCIR